MTVEEIYYKIKEVVKPKTANEIREFLGELPIMLSTGNLDDDAVLQLQEDTYRAIAKSLASSGWEALFPQYAEIAYQKVHMMYASLLESFAIKDGCKYYEDLGEE